MKPRASVPIHAGRAYYHQRWTGRAYWREDGSRRYREDRRIKYFYIPF